MRLPIQQEPARCAPRRKGIDVDRNMVLATGIDGAGGQGAPGDRNARRGARVARARRTGVPGLDPQRDETLRRAALAAGDQGVTADEVALVEADEAVEPGLERVVVGGDVLLPRDIALLEAEAIHRVHAEIGDAVGLP